MGTKRCVNEGLSQNLSGFLFPVWLESASSMVSGPYSDLGSSRHILVHDPTMALVIVVGFLYNNGIGS